MNVAFSYSIEFPDAVISLEEPEVEDCIHHDELREN